MTKREIGILQTQHVISDGQASDTKGLNEMEDERLFERVSEPEPEEEDESRDEHLEMDGEGDY